MIYKRNSLARIVLLSCAAILIGYPPLTQAEATPSTEREPTFAEKEKAGYGTDSALEGPGGVAAELAQDDVDVGSLLILDFLDGSLKPWFNFKRELNEKYGLKLGLSYNALYQYATPTLTDINSAAGGRLQIQGMWTLLGRKTENPGSLSFRVEDRHRLGTDVPPTQLGGQFGYASITGLGFSEYDFTLTELAWRQTVLDGNMKFGFGKISAVSWYNAHALSSGLTGFQNSTMQASGTKPSVGRGLGAVGAYHLHPKFVVLGGIHDANAVTSDSPFDTIDQKEFYSSTEFRWYPTSFDRRKWDQVKLQLWYVDAKDKSSSPSDYGTAFTTSFLLKDRYMPFVSAGLAHGGTSLIKSDITAGLGIGLKNKHRSARDVLGMGFNWSNPYNSLAQDQYTTEVFYRLQVLPHFALTPSFQYIIDPAFNPSDDHVWLGSIRARFTL